MNQLHWSISVCEKSTLALSFKWLVALKRGVPRPKFSSKSLSTSPTLLLPKRAFCGAKVIEGIEASEGPKW